MPSKKRKYNARFPAGRIKRIMQADEEVGKIAQAVPIIISRTLELFVESLLTKSSQITMSRNAKTLSPTHLKQCIMSESRFDFLKDLVKNIPDIAIEDNSSVNGNEEHHGTSNNGLESNNGAHHHHRMVFQRSQSLQQQPSTSSQQQQQYNTVASSTTRKFFLNNYTSIPNNNILSSNNQITTKPNISTTSAEFHPPTKIIRLNSTPVSATITSSEQHQLHKQSLAPLEFPIQISYNIDGKSSMSADSPTVKIDYSKLSLPATSPIKIDLSHFNTQLASSNSNASHQPSSNAAISTTSMPAPPSAAGLDEDYDA